MEGHSSGSKLKATVLNVKGKELIVQAGQSISLTCRGDQTVSWKFPDVKSRERYQITDNACQGGPSPVCLRSVTLYKAQINDTGYYKCQYEHFTSPKTLSAVYIFVTGKNSAFVDPENKEPKVVTITDGKRLIVPCRVTSPDITVTLRKLFEGELSKPEDKNIIWDNKKGFIVRKPSYVFIGLLSCEARVNGTLQKVTYMTHRQTSTIHSVELDVPSSIKILRGNSLTMNCTAITDLNTRPEITWIYPASKFGKIVVPMNRVFLTNDKAVVHSMLRIARVGYVDQGQYICTAKNGPSSKSDNTAVRVHAAPFINVKPRQTGVLEAVVGQKSYHIAVKVRAFPPPEITWTKNKLPAAEFSRYITKGSTLIIRDVAEEDAGEYTVVLRLKQWNLIKNLTMTLKVNVKPHIYEKSLSVQEPYPYTLGSRQSLTCTVFGVPPPTITWTWHPCPRNYSRGRCDFHSENAVPVILGEQSNSPSSNKVQVRERTGMIEGRNKTASTLVIDEAVITGVYSCIASNKLGAERRNIRFFVTDVPNGFHISLDKVPKEGENMTLTCSVNKYLYNSISWVLRRKVGNRTINHSISKQRSSITTEYSTVLTATVHNTTRADSGVYECRATNTYTGDIFSQSKQVIIRGEHCGRKILNSRTSKQRRKNCTTENSEAH
ncbi:vascular endothelial growth factor receptor 1 isoform X2 [Hyperolius riggenbachi]|uniref:vascular endothelial growth factor receptor 1 isoform X2 n=1 Tax=Hyperolius riggenbachi TaxID=752182 RepID=UPI0035A36C13